MNASEHEFERSSPEIPSAFPSLPESADALPAIPGGWVPAEIALGDRKIKLVRPADPDLFLDDAGVHRANEKNDYMPYWAFLWPSAVKMAAAVHHAPWPVGASVLELGAGIGLVGLSAMGRGDCVTFSDYDATALHMCRLNARLNGLGDPELMELDWRVIPDRRFPAIVGCEVTYDAALHQPLLSLIDAILEPGGICWLGDPGRYQAQFFYDLAVKQGFRVQVRNEAGQLSPGPLSNQFQILIIDRI